MVTTTTSKYAKAVQAARSETVPVKKRAAKYSTPKDKAHFCPTCDKPYSRAHDVKRHLRTHESGPKQYPCGRDGCDQDFHQKVALLTHWRIVRHDNIRDQVCKSCDAAFSDRSALSRHERSKHGGPKFLCECGAEFTRKDGLNAHARKYHTPPASLSSLSAVEKRPTRRDMPQRRNQSHRQTKGKVVDVKPARIRTDARPDATNGPARATAAPVPTQTSNTPITISSPRGLSTTFNAHTPRINDRMTVNGVQCGGDESQGARLSKASPEYMALGPRTSALSFILN
ncbi:hypothetical protein SISNIDRAFT_495152 [Sistotremastrum niveocremeum HHB9708]|uniref:C2H2-type domain-containing protein n=2 Tax=Sistotremastraceae TaxID=3402574 RepID=A0A164VEC2_9AGAM|nr:hypothetical protein SISNIDRAFT_495152 [Sistotremastrum niveocremeum HHB9708]KZT32030.1 hypothetical protein SISSUDRAFT_1123620 [Sistotremastrum suecicum HHB10207 ss-3]